MCVCLCVEGGQQLANSFCSLSVLIVCAEHLEVPLRWTVHHPSGEVMNSGMGLHVCMYVCFFLYIYTTIVVPFSFFLSSFSKASFITHRDFIYLFIGGHNNNARLLFFFLRRK